MREFLQERHLNALLTPRIVRSLTLIHESRGRIVGLSDAHPKIRQDTLRALRDVAMVQSTESSNRIEGICTSDNRLNALMADRTTPRDRDEQEIVGYRNVLSLIHERHDFIPISASVILQLHRDLFAQTGLQFGGHWKDADNAIVEIHADGSRHIRFKPTPAIETPDAVNRLCLSYSDAVRQHLFDPLLIDLVFVFDFVSIHPFNDGNGRMSRLLFLLLLYRSGYDVGRYISLERAIEESKTSYYETLKACSSGWSEDENVYAPFVEYLLGVVTEAYADLDYRIGLATRRNTGKVDRVAAVIDSSIGPFSKAELQQQVPDISLITVERTLKMLLDRGEIQKIGGGRGTKYVKP